MQLYHLAGTYYMLITVSLSTIDKCVCKTGECTTIRRKVLRRILSTRRSSVKLLIRPQHGKEIQYQDMLHVLIVVLECFL